MFPLQQGFAWSACSKMLQELWQLRDDGATGMLWVHFGVECMDLGGECMEKA